jgi:hypothetical protein
MTRRSALGLPVLALVPAAPAPAAAEPTPAARARRFLADLVDPALDLLPEFRGSKTFWLFHDNYLAAAVLKPSHPALSAKITAAIGRYGVTGSGKIEIVLGEATRPLPFRRYDLVDVRREGDRLIKTELVTNDPFAGWETYADLLLLAAIAEPNPAAARAHFDAARKMWDAHGFADAVLPVARRYATYKLALALRAASLRRFPFPEADAAKTRMLARQAPDGGFITDYDKHGKNIGVANVETTSLCALALDP